MNAETHWYDEIRSLFDTSFSELWDVRLARFRSQPIVTSSGVRFELPRQGFPPAWFSGDIAALQPRDWVLVVTDNPDSNVVTTSAYDGNRSPHDWWNYWRRFNRDHANFRGNLAYPWLIETAARTLGVGLDGDSSEGHRFATSHMLFVTFCPYASSRWPSFDWKHGLKPLTLIDQGFILARKIRRLIFDYGQPKLVICFGKNATYDVKDRQFHIHDMRRNLITWNQPPGGSLHLYQGTYEPKVGESFKVLGVSDVRDWRRKMDLNHTVIDALANGEAASSLLAIRFDPEDWEKNPQPVLI